MFVFPEWPSSTSRLESTRQGRSCSPDSANVAISSPKAPVLPSVKCWDSGVCPSFLRWQLVFARGARHCQVREGGTAEETLHLQLWEQELSPNPPQKSGLGQFLLGRAALGCVLAESRTGISLGCSILVLCAGLGRDSMVNPGFPHSFFLPGWRNPISHLGTRLRVERESQGLLLAKFQP